MNIWIVMLLGGLLTYGMRLSFIYLFSHFQIPDPIYRTLRFVPPAVLSAIVLPQLFMPNGYFDFSLTNHRWIAGFIAVLAAMFTKNTLLTILIGMTALLILQLVL
jgi:branched-subunit amino acid transport protein